MAKANAKKSEPAPNPVSTKGLPKVSRRGSENRQAPKLERKPPFWLVFCAGGYTVLDGSVVPQLREFSLESGCNGVLKMKDGTLIVDDAEANLKGKGAIPIPWDVDGDEAYLRQVAPDVWVSRWTRTSPGSEFMEPDLVGYAAWLRTLMERDIVPFPQVHDLERMASALRFDIEHSSQNPAVQPHRVGVLKKQLAVVEAELEPAREAQVAEQRADLAAADERRASSSDLPMIGAKASKEAE